MSYYRQAGRKTYMAKMRLWGTPRIFSLETDYEPQARRYHAMLEEIRYLPQGEPVLREWWARKSQPQALQLRLADIHHAWRATDRGTALTALLYQLQDADLQTHKATYLATLPTHSRTPWNIHARAVREFLGDSPFPASWFTVGRIEDWLHALPCQPQSRRKYWSGLRRFGDWLVRRGLIPDNPVTKVPYPKGKRPEIRFLELPEIERVLAAVTDPLCRRALLLAYGGAIERCGLGRLRRRDVQVASRSIMVRGASGKAAARERLCRIDTWAWDRLWPEIRDLLPDAPLLPGYQEQRVYLAHRAALDACHLADRKVTLHCARHAWAVRKLRAGFPVELVARQLGHTDGSMVLKVYGRWLPSAMDWDRFEAMEERGSSRVAGEVAGGGASGAS